MIQKLRRQIALRLIRPPPTILAIVVLVEDAKEARIEDVLIDVADEKKMTAAEDVEVAKRATVTLIRQVAVVLLRHRVRRLDAAKRLRKESLTVRMRFKLQKDRNGGRKTGRRLKK